MTDQIEIELAPVTGSSQIVGLGYDPETKTMRIKFADYVRKRGDRATIPGPTYDVVEVSPEEFEAMRTAQSKGGHFASQFKQGNYTITRI